MSLVMGSSIPNTTYHGMVSSPRNEDQTQKNGLFSPSYNLQGQNQATSQQVCTNNWASFWLLLS